jgi:hypothetical protein
LRYSQVAVQPLRATPLPALAYTIAYSPCAPRPTDPVPRGQLWPTGPIYSLYTAYIQPIYSLYTAYTQPTHSLHTAYIQRCAHHSTAFCPCAGERRVCSKTSIVLCVEQDLYNGMCAARHLSCVSRRRPFSCNYAPCRLVSTSPLVSPCAFLLQAFLAALFWRASS